MRSANELPPYIAFRMNKTITSISLTALLCVAAPTANAQSVASKPSAVRTQWTPDTLRLSFDVSEPKGQGSRFAVWTTPRIATADGDTMQLAPSVFRGNRNRRLTERQLHFSSTKASEADAARDERRLMGVAMMPAPLANAERRLGDTITYNTIVTRADAPWLWQKPATLSLRREKDGCCTTEDLPQRDVTRLCYVPAFVPVVAQVEDNAGRAGELAKLYPVLSPWDEYRPYTSDRVLSREKGALYVHFELDKTTLKHDFRNNAATLDRIVDITRQIMNDSTSDVRRIQIVGLASVEGPLRHNCDLAGGRAAALKHYIQQHVATPDSLYEAVNGCEAWAELRAQIEDLQFEGRDEMLRIIDTEPDPNVRETRLKKLMGGRPYDYLRTHVLADQRNSGYLRIYYDYVPDTAAATINAATDLIRSGNYDEALRQLRTVESDPRAQNALGVALCMTGSAEQGIEHIRRAAAAGNAEAKENLRQWEAIERAKAMSNE